MMSLCEILKCSIIKWTVAVWLKKHEYEVLMTLFSPNRQARTQRFTDILKTLELLLELNL